MQSQLIRALVVDDEQLSRNKIINMLADDTEIRVIGECSNGVQALDMIKSEQPELIFLDIQMPDLDGFGVVEKMDKTHTSHIIFITAFDNYAIRAFEVNAVDYLLKPFNKTRFKSALERAKKVIYSTEASALNMQMQELLETLRTQATHLNRLVIKNSGHIFFLKTEKIDWIESAGNYVVLHCGKESHLYRETLKTLTEQLDPEKFARIHRSKIVNMDKIQEIQPWSHGDYQLTLYDGTELIISRHYKENLHLSF